MARKDDVCIHTGGRNLPIAVSRRQMTGLSKNGYVQLKRGGVRPPRLARTGPCAGIQIMTTISGIVFFDPGESHIRKSAKNTKKHTRLPPNKIIEKSGPARRPASTSQHQQAASDPKNSQQQQTTSQHQPTPANSCCLLVLAGRWLLLAVFGPTSQHQPTPANDQPTTANTSQQKHDKQNHQNT